MTVTEAIKQLKTLPKDAEIQVFAEGNIYPMLKAHFLPDYGVVEIACGWARIEADTDCQE
jgi:hypothetical protein